MSLDSGGIELANLNSRLHKIIRRRRGRAREVPEGAEDVTSFCLNELPRDLYSFTSFSMLPTGPP